MFKLSWSEIKSAVTNKALNLQYLENSEYYKLWALDASVLLTCELSKNPSDTTDLSDFESNFKSTCNKKLIDVDNQGRSVNRMAAGRAGWTFCLLPIELTTAKLGSIFCQKFDETNRSGVTYKIYDNNNTEITESQNEVNAVKTIIDFEPSFDYEIISGELQQKSKPNTNMRVWVVGVPDISEQNGGSKEMVGGVNLAFIDPADKVSVDGRASKYMAYNATYHTNKLRLILRHGAGVQHDVMFILGFFKA